MSVSINKLQEGLREAITWLEKGFVSKEEFSVLKHQLFVENKEKREKDRADRDNTYIAAAKRAQEHVEKLMVENSRLKAKNARLEGYCVDCSRDGVEYTRDCSDGTIYNADFVEVGKWCTSFGDGFIEFSNEGAKKHFEATGRTLPN